MVLVLAAPGLGSMWWKGGGTIALLAAAARSPGCGGGGTSSLLHRFSQGESVARSCGHSGIKGDVLQSRTKAEQSRARPRGAAAGPTTKPRVSRGEAEAWRRGEAKGRSRACARERDVGCTQSEVHGGPCARGVVGVCVPLGRSTESPYGVVTSRTRHRDPGCVYLGQSKAKVGVRAWALGSGRVRGTTAEQRTRVDTWKAKATAAG